MTVLDLSHIRLPGGTWRREIYIYIYMGKWGEAGGRVRRPSGFQSIARVPVVGLSAAHAQRRIRFAPGDNCCKKIEWLDRVDLL